MTDTTSSAMPDLEAGAFTLDPIGSMVEFSTKNFLGRAVNGRFHEVRAVVRLGSTPAESGVEATISVASVDTKSKMRDRDLQKKQIFDAANWPQIHFASTTVTTFSKSITIIGDLTVRDQTRSVTLVGGYTGVSAAGRPVFVAEAVVSPREFGIRHPAVRKPVTIQITAALMPA